MLSTTGTLSSNELFLEDIAPYALCQKEKEQHLLHYLTILCSWHYQRSNEYRRFCQGLKTSFPPRSIEQIPFLPTPLFKQKELVSAAGKTKTILSSSTSSGIPSKIFVSKENALLQQESIQLIFNDFIGRQRRPYIIFDDIQTARGKSSITARGAALMALMPYASQFFFVMDIQKGKLVLNREKLEAALAVVQQNDGECIAYGFSYILHKACNAIKEEQIDLSAVNGNSFLIHSGGWKNHDKGKQSLPELNRDLEKQWGLIKGHCFDFYGMAEQTGLACPTCLYGNKHIPYYTEIIVRDPHTLTPVTDGEKGLVQLLSLLAQTSPNHSILTDDIASITAVDSCPCGRGGKAFTLHTRAQAAKVRGCSAIYQE
ncbi:hypothetical protein JYU14_03240 [Simkania negevensis]|uniref:Acyl-protein synthetase LuxE domain-containing protein n=1 Tax=Simkania negevensis TaxID=83561 RepID=A0ABS3ARS0_9BACT|nr:hypothetical protein [Simkania negevensis]